MPATTSLPITRTIILKTLITVPFCAVILVVYYRTFIPETLDFGPAFYTAAQMLRHGAGHQLYDFALQRHFQEQYMQMSGPIFRYPMFYSPPLAAVPYLPTAWFGLTAAYSVWCVISMSILAVCALILHRTVAIGADSVSVFGGMFLFLPVHMLLIQGQIDALVLLAFVI